MHNPVHGVGTSVWVTERVCGQRVDHRRATARPPRRGCSVPADPLGTLTPMPFPRKLLNPGEEMALDLNPHWIYFAEPVAAFAGALLLTIIFLAVGAPDAVTLAAAILLIGCAGWFGVRYVKWTTTHFVVTTSRIIFKHGIFAKSGIDIPLERVMNVNFHQSFWERIVGAGDLVIESAGKDGQSRFTDIRKPQMVQNMIHAQTDLAEDHRTGRAVQVAQAAAPAAPPDALSQLEKLDDLRRRGVITEQEFAAQKAKLLEKM